MAEVKIDIPGIGEVTAINAASEATLKEILKALGGKGGGGGSGGGGNQSQAANVAMANLGKTTTKQTGMMAKMGAGAKAVGAGFAKLGAGALNVAGIMADVSNALSKSLAAFSKLDNSVTGAAASIPFLGGTFAASAEALDKLVKATQGASSSGASFGGSVLELGNAAARSGMTINEYSNFVRQSGETFRLLGGSVEAGRVRFDSLSKEMRKSNMMTELNMLGYTTQQVNEGMGRYTKILGATGKLQGKTTKQIAAESAKYMKEIDLLAKATGKERSVLEAEQDALLKDAQFQAKVASMTGPAADALRATISGMPAGLESVAKDIISTGTATTDASREFTAMMPQSASMMQEFARITEAGGTISEAQRNELNNLMSTEGKIRKEQYRDQGRFNADMAPTYMGIVNASNLQVDAIKNAAKEQEKQIKVNDGATSGMEALGRRVNEISIEFTNLLASSGIMQSMMNAFELIADINRNILAPALRVLNAILMPIVDFLSAVLSPVIKVVGYGLGLLADAVELVLTPFKWMTVIIKGVYEALEPLATIVGVNVVRAFNKVSDAVTDTLEPAFDFVGRIASNVGDFFQDNLQPAIESVSNFFSGTFTKAMDYVKTGLVYLGDAFEIIMSPIVYLGGKVSDVFTAMYDYMVPLINGFASMGDVVDLVKLKFSAVQISMMEFSLGVKKIMDKLNPFGDAAEEAADHQRQQPIIDQAQATYEQKEQAIAVRFANNREAYAAEKLESDKARDLERAARDAALDEKEAEAQRKLYAIVDKTVGSFTAQTDILGMTTKTLEKEVDLKKQSQSLDGIAALKDFATNNKSFLTNVTPKVAQASVSSAKIKGSATNVHPADGTNALDVLADENVKRAEVNKSISNQDLGSSKVNQLNTDMNRMVALQSETLKTQNRILAAIEEQNAYS